MAVVWSRGSTDLNGSAAVGVGKTDWRNLQEYLIDRIQKCVACWSIIHQRCGNGYFVVDIVELGLIATVWRKATLTCSLGGGLWLKLKPQQGGASINLNQATHCSLALRLPCRRQATLTFRRWPLRSDPKGEGSSSFLLAHDKQTQTPRNCPSTTSTGISFSPKNQTERIRSHRDDASTIEHRHRN